MNSAPGALIRRLAAAVAASTTTIALFSAVVAISEPHRSELIAANAARHANHARAQVEPRQVMSIVAAGNDQKVGDDPTQRATPGQAAAGHVDRDGG